MAANDKRPSHHDRLEWFTVRYRTLAYAALAVIVIGALAWVLLGRRTPQAPPQTSMPEGAHFVSIEGSVQVKRSGTLEWLGATRAMVLRQNDLVRTGSGGAADIRFADGTLFNVRPDSLVTVEESSRNPVSRQRRVALSIQTGEADFQTAERGQAGSTTISTPTVRTTVERNSAGSMLVGESGETGLRMFQGAGQVETTSGQRIRLASNEGLKVDAGGAAGPKTALPRVPQLTAPPNQADLAYPDLARGMTLLLWNPVPGAERYRVLVDYSPGFARPLFDRQGSRSQIELRGLDAGSYYWKVSAIDDAGEEGGFSELWHFTLAKAPQTAATPPVLDVEVLELKGNVLHVRGRTEPGATLVLSGELLEVQPDGSFNEFLTFDSSSGSSVVLRSTGSKGGVAELRRRVLVVD